MIRPKSINTHFYAESLKGGTAIDIFYLDLARLSVDIDLNHIANVSRKEMLKGRPETPSRIQLRCCLKMRAGQR